MPKDDYISDNLITMRDRLRESTAALREAAEEKRNLPPPEREPVRAPEPPPSPMPSDSAASRRQADGMRAKQDLSARLARDRARLEKLLEQTEARRGELRAAQDALDALDRDLSRLSPLDPSGRFAADTDRLRLEYFRLLGTLDALASAPAAADRGEPAGERQRQDAPLLAAAWIVGLTVLAAGGVVAAVVFLTFR